MHSKQKCLFFVLIFATTVRIPATAKKEPLAPTFLIFGDSTVDPGNNNFIDTAFRSNFLPYGQDFPSHMPTGRFTNGRLANDFIAKYLGIQDYVPPYLDPTLSIQELMAGVSFGSAGTGFDPFTPTIGNVEAVTKQLEQLREYKKRVEAEIGRKKMMEMINRTVFMVSAGTNDFILNYFTIPVRRKTYSVPAYVEFLLQRVHHFLQGLIDEGARRIGVVGLPPMGCLPAVITLYSDHPLTNRSCLDYFSSVARDYNKKLQSKVLKPIHLHSGTRLAYMDIYTPLQDMISAHKKYGFEEASCGCCGSGLLEIAFLCNEASPVCENATKYVFWDSIHPSERSYDLVSRTLLPVIRSLSRDF